MAGAEKGGSDDSDDEVLVPQQQATDDDYSSINIILDEGEKESSAQVNGGDVIPASKTSLDVNDATGEDRASLRKGKHKHIRVCIYRYMYMYSTCTICRSLDPLTDAPDMLVRR